MNQFFNTYEIGPFDYPPPPPPPPPPLCETVSFRLPPSLPLPLPHQESEPRLDATMYRAIIQQTQYETQQNQYYKQLYLLEEEEMSRTYPISREQKETARKLFEPFQNRCQLFTLLSSGTQSGKTGIIRELFHESVKQDIPVKHLFCITGKSDVSLRNQTRSRLPSMIPYVLHGPDLKKKFVKAMEGLCDCLIVVDEPHCACRNFHCLAKAFKEAGLLDKAELYRRNIRIVLVSATHNGILYDIQKWGKEVYTIIRGIHGPNYVSCIDLYNINRVFDAKDLLRAEHIKEFGDRIVSYDENGDNPLYHIVRGYSGVKYEQLIIQFNRYFGELYDYKGYTQIDNIDDINDLISVRPAKHTIIFIKEKLRCGKSIFKKYLGILYDRPTYTRVDDSVTIQGLLGRATGYDDNGQIIVYCHIQSIINYIPLSEGDFSPDYTGWSSSSTEVRGKKNNGKNTFIDPVHYKGSGVLPDRRREPKPEAFHIISTSFAELQDCYKAYYVHEYGANHGKRGPQQIKKNADGFYEGTIRQNSHRVLSYDQVLHEKNNAISDKKPCAHKPCYTNVYDSNTLRFVFIHRNPDFSFSTTGIL